MPRCLKCLYIWVITLGCVGLVLLSVNPLMAQEPSEQTWTVEMVRQRRTEVAFGLKLARQAATPEAAERIGIDLETLEARVGKWIQLDSVYGGLLSEIEKLVEIKSASDEVKEEISAYEQRGLLKKPPYPLSLYDELLGEIETLQQAIETGSMDQQATQRLLDESRLSLRGAQEKLQHTEQENITQNSAKALWIREGLQLDIRLADAERLLYVHRSDRLLQQNQLVMNRVELAQRQANVVRLGLAYDAADLDNQIQALDKKQKELQKESKLLQQKKRAADQQWLKAKARVRDMVYADSLARSEATLKGVDQWRKTYQEAIDQHQNMLRLVDQQKDVWRQRHGLLKQVPDRTTLLQWFEQSRERLAQINRILPFEQQRQNSLWQQTSKLEEAIRQVDKTAKQNGNSGFVQALRQMALYRLDYISLLVACRGLEARLSNEIDLHLKRKPFKYHAEKLWTQLRGIWHYQVWEIDGRPLTIQTILVALVILLAGIMATKMVVRRIAKRILTRPQIKTTTAAAIEKLLLYSGYLLVVLFTLRMVNIPLAAFAFLGGAIAIGIGFGAQNLINNFISGFIIMGEQPINIGDLIEVDGVLGQVEEIGARCTRIRTGDNIQILVPNSSFLEKNITNWTLSDRLIRAHVTVGVVYGSPVGHVERLLLEACNEFELIRKSPEPFVLFTDFGDNALMFNIHFWINVIRIIERRKIESQLRFKIDALFREAGIVIAFPQRDVHLDSAAPLKIQLLDKPRDLDNTPNRE